jgi:hypothetical protein
LKNGLIFFDEFFERFRSRFLPPEKLEQLFPNLLLSAGVASEVVAAHHQLARLREEGVVRGRGGRGEGQVDEVPQARVLDDLVVRVAGLLQDLSGVVSLRVGIKIILCIKIVDIYDNIT